MYFRDMALCSAVSLYSSTADRPKELECLRPIHTSLHEEILLRNLFALASLFGAFVLGATFPSFAQNPPPPMGRNPMAATDWSFECGYSTDCGANGQWIPTTSQPGTVRLWDSGTGWAILNPAAGTYDWQNLDTWLDLIAEHQPRAAIYTFGHVPCWITTGKCTNQQWDNWSPGPPRDLTPNGSPAFNAFVQALTQHCSPAGHCVKHYIRYWEMWNEANRPKSWTGTIGQLYDMFKPVIAILRNNIPDAITSTPPVCGGHAEWMTPWMILENTKGRLSDYYGFHVYLLDAAPETRIHMVWHMLSAKTANGWSNVPWMNTETNFINTTYTCSTQFTPEDCRGQLVRWHIMQFAEQGTYGEGATHIGWYNWESISHGGYDTYYYTMMQWLMGAHFTGSCTTQGTVWACPLTEASGATALIVWNAAGNSKYTPGTQYVNYKYFNDTYGGATQPLSSGHPTTIGVIPIMFQTAP